MTQDITPPSEGTQPPAQEPPPKPRAKGRWPGRLKWVFGILLALAVIFRIVLHLALPTVIARVGNYYGLDIDYERATLSLTGGHANLWNVSIRYQDRQEDHLKAEYVQGDLSVVELLKGRLHVFRAEVDGVALAVDREADGSIPVLDHILARLPARKPVTDIDLTSPLRIDALRLNKIRARLRDKSVSPVVETMVDLTVRVSDVAADQRKTRLEIDITADPLVDALRIEGEGTAGGPSLDLDLRAHVRGFHPKPAAGYLAYFGIRPVAHDISGSLAGRVRLTSVNPTTQPATRPANTPQSLYAMGTVALDDVSLMADGEPALLCKSLQLDIGHVNMGSAHISRLAIDGVDAFARRTDDGRLRVAGIELAAVPPEAAPATRPTAVPQASPAAPFRLDVDEIAIGTTSALFRDEGMTPPAALALAVDELNIKGITLDPARPDAPVTVAGKFKLPNLARAVTMSGMARPFAARKTVELAVDLEGLKPDAVQPYLDALGLRSQLVDGRFACRLDAGLSIEPNGILSTDLRLSGLTLKDGRELLALDDVKLSGLRFDPAGPAISIADIAITGPSIAGRRDKTGRIELIGLTADPLAMAASRRIAASSTQPAAAPAGMRVPSIAIGRLTWKDVKARIEDGMVDPPVVLEMTDFGAELSDVFLDLAGTNKQTKPGRFALRMAMPKVVEKLNISGTLTPLPEALGFDVNVAAAGLSPDLLAPYIKPTSIEPVLKSGSVALKASGTVAGGEKGIRSSLLVENVTYADGAEELAGVDRLRVNELAITPDAIRVGAVEMTRPRASIQREADGSFLAGGVRLRLPEAPMQAGIVEAALAMATTRPTTRPATPILPDIPIALDLRKLSIKEGAIAWTDRASSQPVRTTLRASVDLDAFGYPKPAGPATLKLSAKADGSAESFDVAGTFTLTPASQQAQLDVSAAGLRAGPLAAYVPPGIEIALRDGRLKTKIDAALSLHPQGGYAGHLLVDGLDWRDGEGGTPLFHLDAVRAVVTRADLPDTALAVEELTVAGVETDVRLTRDGAIRALSIVLGKTPAEVRKAVEAALPPPVVEEPALAAPRRAGAGADGSAQAAAILAAQALKPLPRVTVQKLDLHVRRASLQAEMRGDAAPLTLVDLRVRSLKPIDWLGADAAGKPPSSFEITGRIEPAIHNLKLTIQAAPFAREPSLVLDVAAAGISGPGILSLAPELKPHVDGSALVDGAFKTHVETQFKFDRRVASDFDLSRGFEMELLVKGTEYRAAAGGPILAGVEELRAEKVRIRPAESTFIAKSIEITRPLGRFHRDDKGIHAMGWIVPLTAAAPATQPAGEPVAEANPAAAPTTQPAAARPTGEVRIDRLSISGLDVLVEDRTFKPAVIVPLTNLDFEARGLSNQMLFEDQPLRFNLLVNSGKVPLPRRLGSAASAGSDSVEERELFSQITASGKLSLYPTLNGWAKSSVNGFELAGARGIAKAAGVTVGGGTVDSRVDVRLPGDGSLQARSRTVLTDTRVTEPPDGPIRRTLQLPSPLDVVIAALEDADGSITVSLPVALEQNRIAWGPVVGAAIGEFGKIVVVATASAPLKVAKGMGSMIGLGGDKRADTSPLDLAFAAGYAGLEADEVRSLDTLVRRLRKEPEMTVTLSHALAEADVSRVRALANPSPADVSGLAGQLRARKLELANLRAGVAGEARAQLASGLDAEPALLRLRAIDRELASAESALDNVYDLLRPGAYQEPQQVRRARSAAIELGRERLVSIRDQLLVSGVPDIEKRINIIKPTFNPAEDAAPGRVIAVPVVKKKSK